MLTPDRFPLIVASLSERDAGRFARALESLERYEEAGLLLQVEHGDLKSTFNRAFDNAWSKQMREPFLNAGRWEKLSPAEYKFECDLSSYPQCHTIAGLVKKLEHKNAPKGAMLDAMIAVAAECAVIGPRVNALKEKIGKRAPAPTKTSMARDERTAKALHCQICGCDILAETGVIAHHGYQRPGDGYQTPSCPGARELPYEADRKVLGEYIEALKSRKIGTEAGLVAVRAEKVDLLWTYNDYSQKRQRWERQPEVTVAVNRANFEEHLAEAITRGSGRGVTFDQIKSGKIIELQSLINSLHRAIVQQTKRYQDWVQVRDWNGAQWVPFVAVEVMPFHMAPEDDGWQS